jgi:hypothetical protein
MCHKVLFKPNKKDKERIKYGNFVIIRQLPINDK